MDGPVKINKDLVLRHLEEARELVEQERYADALAEVQQAALLLRGTQPGDILS